VVYYNNQIGALGLTAKRVSNKKRVRQSATSLPLKTEAGEAQKQLCHCRLQPAGRGFCCNGQYV